MTYPGLRLVLNNWGRHLGIVSALLEKTVRCENGGFGIYEKTTLESWQLYAEE